MTNKPEEMEGDNHSQFPARLARSYSIKDKLLMTLVALVIIALGVFIFNQAVEWRFKYQLLSSPCNLCRELNPNVESCFSQKELANVPKIKVNLTLPYS